jgi:hypothetical protein
MYHEQNCSETLHRDLSRFNYLINSNILWLKNFLMMNFIAYESKFNL